ncbi:MAG: hypothetical protein V4642_11740 [Bacteroidota bacterium]
MNWKIIGIISFVTAMAIAGWWIADGAQIYSKDQRKETVKVKDEIFGTETETIKYVDDFQLGLLPHAAPMIGALVLLGAFSFLKARRRDTIM